MIMVSKPDEAVREIAAALERALQMGVGACPPSRPIDGPWSIYFNRDGFRWYKFGASEKGQSAELVVTCNEFTGPEVNVVIGQKLAGLDTRDQGFQTLIDDVLTAQALVLEELKDMPPITLKDWRRACALLRRVHKYGITPEQQAQWFSWLGMGTVEA